MTIGAMAMTATDVAFFIPPPRRPRAPERRSGGRSVARALISAFRREPAHATDSPLPAPATAHYPI